MRHAVFSIRRVFPIHQLRRCAIVVAVAAAALAVMRCGGSPSGPGSQTPLVVAITPGDGPAQGGTTVHISGANFAAGAAVTIGGAPATDVVVESASAITAKTGAGAAGAADVVVSVGGRTGALAGAFTYLAVSGNPPVISVVTAQGTRPGEPAVKASSTRRPRPHR